MDLKYPIKDKKVNNTPPQFMTDLYQAVTDISTSSSLNDFYKSSLVISAPEIEPYLPNIFKFNLEGLVFSEDDVLEAELHIFRFVSNKS